MPTAMPTALILALLMAPAPVETPVESPTTYTLAGTVRDPRGGQPIPQALVVLQCTCMPETREAQTNDEGQYRFSELPAGQYAVTVLVGYGDVTRIVQVGPVDDR